MAETIGLDWPSSKSQFCLMRKVQFDTTLTLDRAASRPLHEQLEAELREAVRAGRLRAGTALPSSRALAQELGVARGVVSEAYAQLCAEGYLVARPRSGTVVRGAATPPAAAAPAAAAAADRIKVNFHPGLPDLAGFPRARWQQAQRRALAEISDADLGYGDPRGIAALRDALATRLGRARGTVADPERIVVTTGFTQGLALTCRILRDRGARRIAVEDPGFFISKAIVEHAGLETVAVPVDGAGMQVEDLPDLDVDAALVTPAHQSPLGVVLSPARRSALLAWARERGTVVIEDDYDAEYRYDRDPVGTVQGLDPEHVIYIGSASKILSPGMRLGWMLAPAGIVDALGFAKLTTDGGTAVLEQMTFARFVADGELDRHLRRMRLRYRTRRDAMLAALDAWFPDAEVAGVAAGLHVTAWLPEGSDEAGILAGGLARGIVAQGLSWGACDPATARPGLMLGYAGVPEPAIAWGVEQLARAREELTAAS